MTSDLLNVEQAAKLIKLKVAYLNNMRHHGKGPHYEKQKGRVLYPRTSLLAWNAERKARNQARARSGALRRKLRKAA